MGKLDQLVTRGVHRRPLRVLLYGPEGIGKTTWAAGAPAAIFESTEDGYGLLDVARLEASATWADVRDHVNLLLNEDHDFRILVIDTIDHLERLVWTEVCRSCRVESIEDIGYGKGYTQALELFQRLAGWLDALRDRKGMHVVLLGHAVTSVVQNPEGADYTKYTLKMHKAAAAFWKEWADVLLFAHMDISVKTTERGDKALTSKGKARGGDRVIETSATPAFDAKNRFNLPETLSMTWGAFAKAVGIDGIDTSPRVAGAPRPPNLAEARKIAIAHFTKIERLAQVEFLFGPSGSWSQADLDKLREWSLQKPLPTFLESVKAHLEARGLMQEALEQFGPPDDQETAWVAADVATWIRQTHPVGGANG